jgi:catalase-peroxidase
MDASQEQTDVECFAVLEPAADGFRNYFCDDNRRSPNVQQYSSGTGLIN